MDTEKKPEEQQPDETVKVERGVVPEPGASKGQIYLRLEGIYKGDVQIEPGKYITSFLFHLKDLDGKLYLAPVCCTTNYMDTVQKALSRIRPVLLSFAENLEQKEEDVPKSNEVTEVTDVALPVIDAGETVH